MFLCAGSLFILFFERALGRVKKGREEYASRNGRKTAFYFPLHQGCSCLPLLYYCNIMNCLWMIYLYFVWGEPILDGGVFYTGLFGFGILGYLIMRVCVVEIIFSRYCI
jgi:hypothetical protein